MKKTQELFALVVIGMTASATATFAVEPSGTPGERTPPPGQSQQGLLPRNDQRRIVGKVLDIDREQGRVALATEDGVLVVEAPPQELRAINVGDTVSVPRSVLEPPSASPRE